MAVCPACWVDGDVWSPESVLVRSVDVVGCWDSEVEVFDVFGFEGCDGLVL